MSMIWQAYAQWKKFTPFLKSDWDMEDYPVRLHYTPSREPVKGLRLKSVSWSATVINWPGMIGTGESKLEALADLREKLKSYKAKNGKSRRPGAHVPVVFASTSRIDMYPELKADFIECILDLRWAFLSDESSLSDFHTDETDKVLLEKIRKVYGVDVSDLVGGNLADIFEKIAWSKVKPQ